MALDRQTIERKDFPIGRRGYDPDAVDAHLSALADEVDELKRSSRRRTETLAVAASEQVRVIVEAAETSAAEIRRQAEEEAREIRQEASTEAQSTREDATTQAREYVGRVSESTSTMLQRLEAMESELNTLIQSLRTGGNRLTADLQLLESNLDEVKDAVAPRPRFELEPEAARYEPEPARYEPEPAQYEPELAQYEPEPAQHEPEPPKYEAEPAQYEPEPPKYEAEPPKYGAEPEPSESRGPEPAAGNGWGAGPETSLAEEHLEGTGERESEGSYKFHGDPFSETAGSEEAPGEDDTESARLVALNMALNNIPREETDRYLAENFDLADRDRLLDEVYASLEG